MRPWVVFGFTRRGYLAPLPASVLIVLAGIFDGGCGPALVPRDLPTPIVKWAAPAAITYGTPLSGTQLDATANVAGSFTYSPASAAVLSAGNHTLAVTFTPRDRSAYATVHASVPLTVNRMTPPVTWADPTAICYGTVLGSAQLNASSPVAGIFIYSPAAGVMLAAGSYSLTTTFSPTDSTDYNSATASTALTVNPAAPVIAWPAPAPVNWGTALSAAQLDASSPVAGTFTYSPAAGTVLAPGTQTLSVSFAPQNTTDYTSATATVQLAVNRVTPVISWTKPGPIFFGTPLSSNQLDASSNVPGTFSYSPAAGTVLTPGAERLTVSFTPDDSTDYTTATKAVTFSVVSATPIITWPFPPAPFIYGTALGSAQLNATANVPGTFVYSPAAGTVPSVGKSTVTATFTPSDTTNYTTATATVPLTVYASTPPGPAGVIQHVVVIMQENRTFDNLFNDFPGADTVQSGNSHGNTVELQPVPLEQGTDIDHSHPGWWEDWHGGLMDGFTHPMVTYPAPDFPYAYVPQSETVPIWTLAQDFTLGDRMFQSDTGPSFAAHQYMIAGQSQQVDAGPKIAGAKPGSDNLSGECGCDDPAGTTVALLGPNGTDLPGVYPCFDYQTLGDVLDDNGIAWRYYAPAPGAIGYQWSAYDAIRHIRFGPDWLVRRSCGLLRLVPKPSGVCPGPGPVSAEFLPDCRTLPSAA